MCGMTVDPTTAEHRAEHAGDSYFFCSAGCREQFMAEPARYVVGSSALGDSHQGFSSVMNSRARLLHCKSLQRQKVKLIDFHLGREHCCAILRILIADKLRSRSAASFAGY